MPDYTAAITAEDDEDVKIFWDSDLTLQGVTNTVSIAAESYSAYQADDTNKLTASDEFDVSILSPCEDSTYTTITAVDQTQPASDTYSGTNVVFTYTDYTVEPSFCTLYVTCEGVTNPSNDIYSGPLTELSCPVAFDGSTLTLS